jgi:hypothetical protein
MSRPSSVHPRTRGQAYPVSAVRFLSPGGAGNLMVGERDGYPVGKDLCA